MTSNRRIGIALDFSEGSKKALKWGIDNLVQASDTLLIIHVKPSQGDAPPNLPWSTTGSPLIPMSKFRKKEDMSKCRVEIDDEVLDLLDTACRQKQVNVVAKLYWGDAREIICESIGDLKLDMLVMGSRGLGLIQRVLLGSVTSYVNTNAACPVTVVKHSAPSGF